MGLLVSIGLFFMVPDSRGLSFEELDYLYVNKVSPRKFQKAIKDRIMHGEALEVTVGEKTLAVHVDHAIVPKSEKAGP
jgi:hypothetical protein